MYIRMVFDGYSGNVLDFFKWSLLGVKIKLVWLVEANKILYKFILYKILSSF